MIHCRSASQQPLFTDHGRRIHKRSISRVAIQSSTITMQLLTTLRCSIQSRNGLVGLGVPD